PAPLVASLLSGNAQALLDCAPARAQARLQPRAWHGQAYVGAGTDSAPRNGASRSRGGRRNRITHSVHRERAVEAIADRCTARSESTKSTVAAIARCSGVVSSPGRTLAGLVTPRPASLSCSAGMLRHGIFVTCPADPVARRVSAAH